MQVRGRSSNVGNVYVFVFCLNVGGSCFFIGVASFKVDSFRIYVRFRVNNVFTVSMTAFIIKTELLINLFDMHCFYFFPH